MKLQSLQNQIPSNITEVGNLPDLNNDPYVVKKVAQAKAFLKKHPLPKHLIRRKTKKSSQ